jgi:hypothetical protein
LRVFWLTMVLALVVVALFFVSREIPYEGTIIDAAIKMPVSEKDRLFLTRAIDAQENFSEAGRLALVELSLNHPSSLVRFIASRKFNELKVGDDWYKHNDEFIKPYRDLRLRRLNAELVTTRTRPSKKALALLNNTLADVFDTESLLLAIDSVRRIGEIERDLKIPAYSDHSLFPLIAEYGLIGECYPASWASRLGDDEKVIALVNSEAGATNPVVALARAMQVFGDDGARYLVTRLSTSARRIGPSRWAIPHESSQIVSLIALLNGHSVAAVDDLIRLLEPGPQLVVKNEQFWPAYAIVKAFRYSPATVREKVVRSRIDRDGEYKWLIRNFDKEHPEGANSPVDLYRLEI